MARSGSSPSIAVVAAILFLASSSLVYGANPDDFLKELAEASIFSRILQLITSAGLLPQLVEALANSNITLFAPRDVWLEQNVNDAVLSYLTKPENVEDLKAVLLFHGTSEGLSADTLRSKSTSEYTSFLGEPLHIKYAPGKNLRIEDNTPIKRPDAVKLGGSYVHGIDGLLIPKKGVLPNLIKAGVVPGYAPAPSPGGMGPPYYEEPPAMAPVAPGPIEPPPPVYPPAYGSTLIAKLNDGKHTKLLEALTASGLASQLADIRDPVTVIAPTDKAFDALPQGVKDALGSDSPLLREILLYHLIPGTYGKKDLLTSAKKGDVILQTYQGESVTVKAVGRKLQVAGATTATIGTAKSDSVSSILDADAVLVPPSLGDYINKLATGAPVPAPAPSPYGPYNAPGAALLDALDKDGKHKVLLAALGAAGLTSVIAASKTPITLFAPTDEAFAAAGPGVKKALEIPAYRDKILNYHAVPETLTIPTLAAAAPEKLPTLEGSKISTSPDGDGVVLDGGAKLTPVGDTNAISTDSVLVPSSIKAEVEALGLAPAPAPSAPKKKKSKKGVIVAAVVGSILGFLGLLVCCWACFATYDKRKREDESGDRPVGAIEEARARRLTL